jgi:hypothetical protein
MQTDCSQFYYIAFGGLGIETRILPMSYTPSPQIQIHTCLLILRNNRGSDYDQNILYACVEISQQNPSLLYN